MERQNRIGSALLGVAVLLVGTGSAQAQFWVPPTVFPLPQSDRQPLAPVLESMIEDVCDEADTLVAELGSAPAPVPARPEQEALTQLLHIALMHCQDDPQSQQQAIAAALQLARQQAAPSAAPRMHQERLIQDLRESITQLTVQRDALLESNNRLQFTIIQARQQVRDQQNLANMKQAISQLEQRRPSGQTFTLAPPKQPIVTSPLQPALEPLPPTINLDPSPGPETSVVESPLRPLLTPQPDENWEPVDHQALEPLPLESLRSNTNVDTPSLLQMMESLQEQYREFQQRLEQLESINRQQRQLESELHQQAQRMRAHGIWLETLERTLQPPKQR